MYKSAVFLCVLLASLLTGCGRVVNERILEKDIRESLGRKTQILELSIKTVGEGVFHVRVAYYQCKNCDMRYSSNCTSHNPQVKTHSETVRADLWTKTSTLNIHY